MSFNAQIRADIETLDVTINNYERMANAPQAWDRIKKILAEEKFTSTNSARDEILLCVRHSPCHYQDNDKCTSDQFCHNQRKTSPVA